MTEEDPEVLADMQLRIDTEADKTRKRRTTNALGLDWPPAFSGQWLCRRPSCGNLVSVTKDAVDIADTCDGWLVRRNEPKLVRSEIVFCDDCMVYYRESRGPKLRERVDEMAKDIAALKEATDPPGETEILARLKKYGHPDIPGLLRAIRDRRSPPTSSGRRREP